MKRQILIGLLPILCLFAGVGLYAIVLFRDLGGKIDVILKENYRSVLAGEAMKEGLARMDSAVFLALAGADAARDEVFQRGKSGYADGLDQERANVTLSGERELADRAGELFQRYVATASRQFSTPDPAEKNRLYLGSLVPLSRDIRDTLQEIIRINQQNMTQADRDARTKSKDSIRYIAVAVGAGIIASILLALRLQATTLKPIRALTGVARDLGEGNLDQVVPVQSRDEIGELAVAFNRMAAKLRAYRQVTSDQILQARQMTELTLSAFPDPIFAYSLSQSVNFSNPAGEKLLPRLGGRLPDEILAEMDRVLKGGGDYLPSSFQHAIAFRVDDREMFLLPKVVGIRDETGGVTGAVVVLQDVTRFRLMDDVKTNLVSTVSHELKTPLTSIRMGLHLLLEESVGPLQPKQLELVLAAREDSERLLRLINDLLDLARLEAGDTRRAVERTAPQTLVNAAVDDLTPLAAMYGCRLQKRVAPGLPQVNVDLKQIPQVFSNLISNAAKHSTTGDKVLVEAAPAGDRVRFSVTDQGPGIPKEYQERIFDRFYQVPGGERAGVGLGLAIAREIVRAHGGELSVESVPGQYTRFYFDLPAVEGPLV
ncbi:MAG TPA: ATP-binding protein [Chthoniobacterales bacterium]